MSEDEDLRLRVGKALDYFTEVFGGNDGRGIVKKELEGLKGAFLLEGYLTEEECRYLMENVEYEEEIEFNRDGETYRKNHRIQISHEGVADMLYARALPYLPAEYHVPATEVEFGFQAEGTWTPHSLNPSLRICKYHPGGLFKPHYDGIFLRQLGFRSLWTFMVYLNDGFEGGATNFLAGPFDEGTVLASLRVQPGTLICFPVHLYHEGLPLTSGEKYILRSDLMFKRDNFTASAQTLKAEEYLALAREYERCNQCDEAVACYKKAFKLDPTLEQVL
eukprot:TRINITY_DN10270_c0_g2_i1.p1 TRINITY_DN10270_c0_g2~~TRINITY_DN10270_c0_g2_i1.p1  ORF type:complete len:288 (+),score=96.68 TRINITY_DN10270_c0_g2_i1:34-864(+)